MINFVQDVLDHSDLGGYLRASQDRSDGLFAASKNFLETFDLFGEQISEALVFRKVICNYRR